MIWLTLTPCNLQVPEDRPTVDWANGLPISVLTLVAGGRQLLKGMRGVNHRWKAGFDLSVTHVSLSWVGPDNRLSARFPSLVSLEAAYMTDSWLKALTWTWKRVTSLKVSDCFGLTPFGYSLLRGLPLTRLSLDNCWGLTGEVADRFSKYSRCQLLGLTHFEFTYVLYSVHALLHVTQSEATYLEEARIDIVQFRITLF